MYCPKCGKENEDKQRFCRACGLGLQTISDAMASELSTPRPDDQPKAITTSYGRNWRYMTLHGFLLLLMGLVIIIVGKKLFGEQLVADIGTALSVAGGVLFVVSVIRAQSGSSARASVEPAKEVAIPQAKPTKELPPGFPDAMPVSVTEHTTRNFEPVPRERTTD